MNTSKIKLLSAMGIFGTIGIFVRYIPLPSAAIALTRGVLGVVFLLTVMLLSRKKPDFWAIKKNFLILCVSGAAIGFNWILLFESYKHTSVAIATVCYYMAPVFLILASPLLGERLTLKRLLCIGFALVGMAFVSGILDGPALQLKDLKGIFLGIGAALLYATVMFLNKKLSPIGAYDKTVLQLGSATVILIPYLLLTQTPVLAPMTSLQWLLLLCVGILHTGIAYTLYFGSMRELSADTVAIFSYLDPVLAILLSAFVLGEKLNFFGILGSVLILGSALYSELPTKK